MIPKTNENYYEISWQVRDQLVDQLLAQGVKDLDDLLLRFDQTERRYLFGVETATRTDGSGETFLTGKVDVTEVKNANIRQDLTHIENYLRPLKSYLTEDVDLVVELGCGYGRNLFLLDRIWGRPDIQYIAAEYTGSGRALAEKLHKGFVPEMRLKTAFVDHKNPDFSFLEGAKNILMFTSHSIEQVQHIPEDYFAKLVENCDQVTGIHLEPFGYQIPKMQARTLDHRAFMEKRGYNANLYEVLNLAKDRGEIKLSKIVPNISALQVENPTSLAVWTHVK